MSFGDGKRTRVIVRAAADGADLVPGIEGGPKSHQQFRGELTTRLSNAVEELGDLPAVLPELVGEPRVSPAAPSNLRPDEGQRGGRSSPEFRTTTSRFHSEDVLSNDSPVNRHVLATARGPLPFVSMSASSPGEGSTLGDRLNYALALENRSQTEAEGMLMLKHPEMFTHRGVLSSYVTGRRGKLRPDPKIIEAIADFLHVEFKWLLLGSGPVRREGRGETPAETALFFARTMRIREDAWEVAWDRNKDRAELMDVEDWFNAIRAEAERLDRANIPRPEAHVEAMDQRTKIRRAKKKKEIALEKKASEPDPVVATRTRASGGM